MPDEDAPTGRNHGGSLTDGVGHGRANHMRPRRHEVQHRARTPDQPAEKAPCVPAQRSSGKSCNGNWFAAIKRLAHEQDIHRNSACDNPDGKEERGSIRPRRFRAFHGLRHKRVKRSHQQSGREAERHAALTQALLLDFTQPIGHCIENDRRQHQSNSSEKHPGVAAGTDCVAACRADHQRESDADRECHG